MESWFAGFHHFYLGLAFLLVGFILLGRRKETAAILFFIAGCALCADDMYQHFRNLSDPAYRSPLHILYGYVYPYLKWLNRIFDWIFGKR